MSFYRALLRNPSVKRRAGHGFQVVGASPVSGEKALTTAGTKGQEGKLLAVPFQDRFFLLGAGGLQSIKEEG
jgi:hypothetical protein